MPPVDSDSDSDSDGRLTAAPALTVAATVKHHNSKGPRRAGAPDSSDSARDYAIIVNDYVAVAVALRLRRICAKVFAPAPRIQVSAHSD